MTSVPFPSPSALAWRLLRERHGLHHSPSSASKTTSITSELHFLPLAVPLRGAAGGVGRERHGLGVAQPPLQLVGVLGQLLLLQSQARLLLLRLERRAVLLVPLLLEVLVHRPLVFGVVEAEDVRQVLLALPEAGDKVFPHPLAEPLGRGRRRRVVVRRRVRRRLPGARPRHPGAGAGGVLQLDLGHLHPCPAVWGARLHHLARVGRPCARCGSVGCRS
mmetsp:Transcript_21525/g.53401  ORF Transcript_21525/g.53401 Transcript_21525/m.53401 type:complete len:219 (+) Transcript_21525:860-1516(+)